MLITILKSAGSALLPLPPPWPYVTGGEPQLKSVQLSWTPLVWERMRAKYSK